VNRKNINANALISLAGELTVAICRQMSPLIIVLAGIALLASTFAIAFRDTSLLPVLTFSLKASFFYAFLPFWTHEMGHIVASSIFLPEDPPKIESTLFRISVVTKQPKLARDAKIIACMGPFSAAFLAFPAFAMDSFGIGIACLAHLIFLFPPFGDGRILWQRH
jgi:hypothetical protein